jgi:thiol-disulfide isomerase/thioredoxin
MRTLLAAALLFGVTACSQGDEKKVAQDNQDKQGKQDKQDKNKEPERKAQRLKVGDPAPPLRADKWLNGPEVGKFEADKVYVVDFWATWCGPCIQMMPHLAELGREHKDQGLVVVAATTIDRINPLAAVESFVEKRGKELGFPFAVAETEVLNRTYMEASGSNSLPTTFVIDKAGKVAFIGHPMQLDDVLPRVLDGTWRGQPDIDAMAKAEDELDAIFVKSEKDAAGAVKDLADFEARYPYKARQPMFQVSKVVLLAQARQFDEARKLTEGLIPKLKEKKDARLLHTMRQVWSDKGLNPDRKHVELAVKAAEAALEVQGEKDWQALIGVAEAHHTAGNKAKAVEYAEKAIAAAEDDDQKAFLKMQLERYKGEDKEKEKK